MTAVERHHDVVLLATAQRVVNQVAIGADPDAGSVPFQVSGKVLFIHYCTVHNVPRDPSVVANILLAYHRFDPVGTDQSLPAVRVVVLVVHDDAIVILLDALDAGRS
ncbi:hypothetical protein FQZ97_1210390 [compost metagenome]